MCIHILWTAIEIRAVTAESVRRTHDIGPLRSIHRTHAHTHTRVHTHTHTHTRTHAHANASSHLAEPAALFPRKSDLPDTIVARTSGFVRGRRPKDSGYSPVEIPPAASADLSAPRRRSDRSCFSVVLRQPAHQQ